MYRCRTREGERKRESEGVRDGGQSNGVHTFVTPFSICKSEMWPVHTRVYS